jgi:hypothetical protein
MRLAISSVIQCCLSGEVHSTTSRPGNILDSQGLHLSPANYTDPNHTHIMKEEAEAAVETVRSN